MSKQFMNLVLAGTLLFCCGLSFATETEWILRLQQLGFQGRTVHISQRRSGSYPPPALYFVVEGFDQSFNAKKVEDFWQLDHEALTDLANIAQESSVHGVQIIFTQTKESPLSYWDSEGNFLFCQRCDAWTSEEQTIRSAFQIPASASPLVLNPDSDREVVIHELRHIRDFQSGFHNRTFGALRSLIGRDDRNQIALSLLRFLLELRAYNDVFTQHGFDTIMREEEFASGVWEQAGWDAAIGFDLMETSKHQDAMSIIQAGLEDMSRTSLVELLLDWVSKPPLSTPEQRPSLFFRCRKIWQP